MRTSLCRRSILALGVFAVAACAEIARDPVSAASPDGPRTTTSATSDIPSIADLDALFGTGMYSLDTTSTGNSARLYIDAASSVDEEPPTFCRDHFEPIDLWYDGGWGIATIHLDPPLLFVGYRPGNVRSGVLRFRRAVYETIEASEGTDPAGNVWRFKGRFNALCRQGELELGPIVVGAQAVVSQDPIDRPVLVRRADSGCGGGGNTALIENVEYNPYSPEAGWTTDAGGCTETGSGTPYQPGDYTGGETVDWGSGEGNGGTSVCGDQAMVEYVCIDVYNEETGFWEEWGCGYVTTC